MRKLLLAERSLIPLWHVLVGWSWYPAQGRTEGMTSLAVLRLWARHSYSRIQVTSQEVQSISIVGLPGGMAGRVEWEKAGISFLDLLSVSVGGAGKDEETNGKAEECASGAIIGVIPNPQHSEEQKRQRIAFSDPLTSNNKSALPNVGVTWRRSPLLARPIPL